jgi:hypothetical protein
MLNPIKEILNSRAIQRIRFGGIVGKLALLGVCGVVAAAAIGIANIKENHVAITA